MTRSWQLSGDLAAPFVIAAGLVALVSLALLLLEVRGHRPLGGRSLVLGTGLLALGSLLLAVLRPVRVETHGATVGPRVMVLYDASRSIDLPADGRTTRRELTTAAMRALSAHFGQVRGTNLVFGAGPARPLADAAGPTPLPAGAVSAAAPGSSAPIATEPPPLESRVFDARPQEASDLGAALASVAAATEELPQALVVVSDGRLDHPTTERVEDELRLAMGHLRMPVHTVALTRAVPADAAVRAVRMPAALVAHQPTSLTVEIACTGGLACSDVPVVARELHLEGEPAIRASGTARVEGGTATVDLSIVLDRAGTRILEVAIEAPEGDAVPDNDRRYLTVEVTRDRVRLLHVAGRPTYDVRALRTWLKSDASVDVVAFFILRTHTDNVRAQQEDLALIPFPVDELFTRHLPSFDAVVLQDFDAQPYGLDKHLSSLARYVRLGGGLIMVGGPNAFVSGNYAGTPLSAVLPVSLDGIERRSAVDFASFVPPLTESGRRAPVLDPLRTLLAGAAFPAMPGANVVGDARPGATVLMTHPTRSTRSGKPMPVLALAEYGSGRTIALTVDGSHKLQFSRFAAGSAGRAHGAFWDALLGWLMRDPRFEPATVALPHGCIAGERTTLLLRTVFGQGVRAQVVVAEMGSQRVVHEVEVELPADDAPVAIELGSLRAGGYTATVAIEQGAEGEAGSPSRHDFACEVGGEEWADVRPDPELLARIAQLTKGVAVDVDDIAELPMPEAAQVITERRVSPILAPWAWSLIAAASLGVHWLVRRRTGFT